MDGKKPASSLTWLLYSYLITVSFFSALYLRFSLRTAGKEVKKYVSFPKTVLQRY